MASNSLNKEPSYEALKSDSARQRWEWFHRAIALAKQSNDEAMKDYEEARESPKSDSTVNRADPQLSIAR